MLAMREHTLERSHSSVKHVALESDKDMNSHLIIPISAGSAGVVGVVEVVRERQPLDLYKVTIENHSKW